jgi:hypothetical protein
VNERIESLSDAFSVEMPIGDFVCECADESCSERIGVTLAEYEGVRADGNRFLVAPAETHYFAEVERLVEMRERFWIVEKFEHGGRVAMRLNPRTRKRVGDGKRARLRTPAAARGRRRAVAPGPQTSCTGSSAVRRTAVVTAERPEPCEYCCDWAFADDAGWVEERCHGRVLFRGQREKTPAPVKIP